jgi:hypothetical protein
MGSTVSYYWDKQEKFDKITTVSGGMMKKYFPITSSPTI